MIHEIHSSDLSAECLKSVQLRHEGKIIGESTTALFRGSLWHAAAQSWHTGPRNEPIEHHVSLALAKVRAESERENRPISPSVAFNIADIQAEIVTLLKEYAERIVPMLDAMALIGCEIPIRMTMDVDYKTQELASHLDLLYRAPSGALCLYDWKTGDDAPSFDYLRRNLQLGMYSLMLRDGECLIDGEWVSFQQWPISHWIHVNNLAPYGRKTTDKEGNEYKKGDRRPIDKIIIETGMNDDLAVRSEINKRVRMMRADLYPMNPGEQRCRFCESRTFCPSF